MVGESSTPEGGSSPGGPPQKRVFKIIVVGDSGVGKTCLTYRFCEGRFPGRTEATIGVDFREKTFMVDDETIKLQLWDTGLSTINLQYSMKNKQGSYLAGQERFRRSMVHHYYKNVDAVVFVYDSLSSWIEECNDHHLSNKIPRILVGNKCDIKEKVMVKTNRAQIFADVHDMPLFETSAKDDSLSNHVESIFLTLAHKLKNARPMMPVHMSQWPTDSRTFTDDHGVVRLRDGACQSVTTEGCLC